MTSTTDRAARRALRHAAMVSALALMTAVAPQAPMAQTYAFDSVAVEGNRRIETGTILTYAGIARGETVTAAELNDAAQAIRATGLFREVEVVPQGSRLVIRVEEYPTVSRIAFEGNQRLSDEQLSALVQSQARRVYNPAQAEADVDRIAAAYAQSGRVNAVVDASIIRRSDNRVDLVFEIVEGGLTEIERVSFVGNRTFSDRRLRGVLETKQAGLLRVLVQRDTFVADRIALDRQMLTDFYRSRGYVDFEVRNVDVALTRERDAYLLTFNVEEGQQFRVGDVSVTSEIAGADPALFREAAALRPGQVYSPEAIDRDIERLEVLATRRGFDFLRVDPRIERNDRDLTLDVTYALVQGPRIFVERIDIEGNTTTLDRVIRRQFRTVEGDPFNPREIRRSAQRIRALGFFADAEVEAREGSSPDQVVIDVDVQERPTGSLSFGANYSGDEGVSLIASFEERNFLGRGQALEFNLSTGQSNRVVSLDFTEPAFLGRDLRFGFSAAYRTTDNQNALYDTDSGRISPLISFPVSEGGRLGLYYAVEYTDITGVGDDASPVIMAEADEGAVTTQSVGYSYSYDTRRNGFDTSSGLLLRFGQEFGVGDEEFVKTTALASADTLVWNEDVRLTATLEGGALNYADGSSRVTDRFFLGSRVMRGFAPRGIGPRDPDTDDALGGNYYAVARLEAQFPLGLPEEYGITGGVFVDYGSVWDVGETYGEEVIYNDFTPRTVAGLALFWTTPLGPLRFNFTEALDAQEEDEVQNFDVTISTSF